MAELVSRYPLTGVRSATPAPHQALIRRAVTVLEGDARVLAAWLVGSFATGEADAFSDVDLQVLVTDEAASDLQGSWPAFVEQITPTVRTTPFPGMTGGTCVTPEWLHLDVVFHAASFDPSGIEGMVPLLDRDGRLPDHPVARPDARGAPFFPSWLVDWFLYMVGASVGVVGRNEVVPGSNGVLVVRDIGLVGLFLAEQGLLTTRAHSPPTNPFPFTKRLRPFLTEEQHGVLESLPPIEPTIDAVVDGYRALARAFLPRARALADATDSEWPTAYEAATLAHYERGIGVPLLDG
jgi:hypothetical protein